MYTDQNFWPLQAGRSGPYVYRPEFLASTGREVCPYVYRPEFLAASGREVWPICIYARISGLFRPGGLAHMYTGQKFLASTGREVWAICIQARISGLYRPGSLAHMYISQNFWPLQAGRSGPYVNRPEFLASSGREVWPICK